MAKIDSEMGCVACSKDEPLKNYDCSSHPDDCPFQADDIVVVLFAQGRDANSGTSRNWHRRLIPATWKDPALVSGDLYTFNPKNLTFVGTAKN